MTRDKIEKKLIESFAQNKELNILEKIKNKIRDVLEIHSIPEPEFVVGIKKGLLDIFKKKIEKSRKKILEIEKFKIEGEIIDEVVQITITQNFNLLPEEIIILKENKEISKSIEIIENKITIKFPYKSGIYKIEFCYIDNKKLKFEISV